MRSTPSSPRATRAGELVEGLQQHLVDQLQSVAAGLGQPTPFQPVSWLRDGGRHGGGTRYVAAEGGLYNRASVNISAIHYDDLPDKRLGSATALSAIVHPDPPRGPSMHLHTSWTELRDGTGYWRVMADLNPSLPAPDAATAFEAALRAAAPDLFDEARAQGDRYFHIPALGRHRGVVHFYLECWTTGDFEADLALARRVEAAAIDTYAELLRQALLDALAPTEAERSAQLAYHTLYLFQVLTLDRGTTSGLLVHDQNDLGILGSLPARVDRDLLASWASAVPDVQRPLVQGLADALPGDGAVEDPVKQRLAHVVRAFYRAHPEALALQASGDVVPPTVANHR